MITYLMWNNSEKTNLHINSWRRENCGNLILCNLASELMLHLLSNTLVLSKMTAKALSTNTDNLAYDMTASS